MIGGAFPDLALSEKVNHSVVRRLSFCSDIAVRESHILDRSDREGTPGRHANCVNTIITLPRVPKTRAAQVAKKRNILGVQIWKPYCPLRLPQSVLNPASICPGVPQSVRNLSRSNDVGQD